MGGESFIGSGVGTLEGGSGLSRLYLGDISICSSWIMFQAWPAKWVASCLTMYLSLKSQKSVPAGVLAQFKSLFNSFSKWSTRSCQWRSKIRSGIRVVFPVDKEYRALLIVSGVGRRGRGGASSAQGGRGGGTSPMTNDSIDVLVIGESLRLGVALVLVEDD